MVCENTLDVRRAGLDKLCMCVCDALEIINFTHLSENTLDVRRADLDKLCMCVRDALEIINFTNCCA